MLSSCRRRHTWSAVNGGACASTTATYSSVPIAASRSPRGASANRQDARWVMTAGWFATLAVGLPGLRTGGIRGDAHRQASELPPDTRQRCADRPPSRRGCHRLFCSAPVGDEPRERGRICTVPRAAISDGMPEALLLRGTDNRPDNAYLIAVCSRAALGLGGPRWPRNQESHLRRLSDGQPRGSDGRGTLARRA